MILKKLYDKKILFTLFFTVFASSTFLILPEKAGAVAGIADVSFVTLDAVTDPVTLGFYTDTSASLKSIFGVETKQATEQTTKNAWDVNMKVVVERTLAALARLAAYHLIDSITEETVNWINTGFNSNGDLVGSPAYVSDPLSFLQRTADQTVGDMLWNDPDLKFLCGPFQFDIKYQLGLNYSQKFRDKINCSLSQAIQNAGGAIDNFVNLGNNGWANWIQFSTYPQNNAVGAYLAAQNELNIRIGNHVEVKKSELAYGQGALALKGCEEVTYDDSGKEISKRTYLGSESYDEPKKKSVDGGGYTQTRCNIKTPGAVITSMLNEKATSQDKTNSITAAIGDGLDQIIVAGLNKLLNVAVYKIKNGILNTDPLTNGQNEFKDFVSGAIYTTQANAQSQLNNSGNYQTQTSYVNPLGGNLNLTLPANQQSGAQNYDVLFQEKASALSDINATLSQDNFYLSKYKNAKDILTSANTKFATAKTCNLGYQDPSSQLRAQLIYANVVTNINGQPDPGGRSVGAVSWNLPTLDNQISLIQGHINFLNAQISIIQGADSTTTIDNALTSANSTPLAFTPIGLIVDQVNEWLNQMKDNYTFNQLDILNPNACIITL